MAQPRHLTNAPIREALIDIRVKTRPDLEPAHLGEAKRQLQLDFPLAQEQRRAEAVLRMTARQGELPAEVHDLGFHGFLLRSADQSTAVQLRTDGFTYNRLRPYTSWEDVFPKAISAWRVYCGVAQPEVVQRLALRYINHIPLPKDMADFDDYLEFAPKIPADLPQYMSGFVTQVVISDPDTKLDAAIRQSLEVNLAKNEMAVLMDIDAYRIVQLEPESQEVLDILSQLRTFKNRVFFASLTEATVRLFE